MDKGCILQWNCRGYFTSTSSIKELHDKYNPAVIALQELIMGQRNTLSLRGYHSMYSPGRGGAGLLIRRDVPLSRISLRTTLQAVAATVNVGKQFTVCSIYLPPNTPIAYAELRELMEQIPSPRLLLGDLNARDPAWGDHITNARATHIKKLMEDFDMGVLNTGDHTHYHRQTDSHSCIDISMISTQSYTDFNWRVITPTPDEQYDSDHYPIILNKINNNSYQPEPEKFNLARANWNAFQFESAIELQDEMSVNEMNDSLTRKILEAATKTIPRTRHNSKACAAPYWNEACERAKLTKKRLQTKMRRSRNQRDRIEYNRARAQERLCIREAKRTTWRNYISTINTSTPPAKIWKKIRKISGKNKAYPIPVVKDANGEIQTEPEIVAEIIGNKLAEYSSGENTTESFKRTRERLEQNEPVFGDQETEYNVPLSMEELKEALSKCKDTSPGPDEIHYAMIRHLHPSALQTTLKLFNKIWQEGTIPDAWRMAIVIPIKKEGKNGLDPSHYRPISLTSCLCKLMERMTSKRLQWYLEKEDIIAEKQFGFRKRHSTADPLLILQNDISQAFARKRKILAVSFDLEKAYDTTWKWGIRKTLHNIGLRGSLPKFLSDLLKEREFKVRIGKHVSQAKSLIEGLPQGAVESCDLFKIAINELSQAIPPDVKYSLYVDDLIIYCEGRNMNSLERRIQNAINRIVTWAENHGYRFSGTKTKAILFSRRGERNAPSLRLNDQQIPIENEIKFLGLTFDSRLTWTSHIKRIKKECQSPLTMLRHLAHLDWGADKKTLERLYKALIQSKLTYACEVFGNDKTTEALNKIQNEALRITSGAFKSSPIKSMQVDSQMLPYDLQMLQTSCRHYIRNKSETKSATRETITEALEEGQNWNFRNNILEVLGENPEEEIKVVLIKMRPTPPWQITTTRVCEGLTINSSCTTPHARAALFREHAVQHSESKHMYTDGSKSEEGVGSAVWIPSENLSKTRSLPKEASIFTAEAIAIYLALKIAKRLPDQEYTVYSDSRSVLMTLQQFEPKNSIIQILKEQIHALEVEENKRLTFCWTPAHVGIQGNEVADKIAKEAAKKTAVVMNLPYSDYYPYIRKIIFTKWQNRWNDEQNNKLHAIRPTIRRWESSYHKKRRYETILSRLRIGHCNFSHVHLMKKEDQPRCCGVPLTVKHALASCAKFRRIREEVYPGIENLPIEERMKKILAEGEHFNIELLIKYLKRTELIKKV